MCGLGRRSWSCGIPGVSTEVERSAAMEDAEKEQWMERYEQFSRKAFNKRREA